MTPALTEAPGTAPHVLVLMATYNGAGWLDEQLDSIARQEGVRTSVLVADDGSTDDTLAVLARWRNRGLAIEWLDDADARRGAAGTFFRLIQAAGTETVDAVALADQDDVWDLDRLAHALRLMRERGLAGYSSDALAFWADGRSRRLRKACPQVEADYIFEPAGPGCTYVLSPGLMRTVQGFLREQAGCIEGIGYHDWWLYAFARSRGLPWMIDDRPTVRYRQHAHNELGANFGVVGVRRRWSRLTSGWFRRQVLLLARAWPDHHQTQALQRLQCFGLRDRVWLALRARRFRRRGRDQVALAVMLLCGVLR